METIQTIILAIIQGLTEFLPISSSAHLILISQISGWNDQGLLVDVALGAGGIPKGRITEIFGAESSGKTTLAYHVAAETQKAGGIAAFIDVEHALDPLYAEKCGINIEDLLISNP